MNKLHALKVDSTKHSTLEQMINEQLHALKVDSTYIKHSTLEQMNVQGILHFYKTLHARTDDLNKLHALKVDSTWKNTPRSIEEEVTFRAWRLVVIKGRNESDPIGQHCWDD